MHTIISILANAACIAIILAADAGMPLALRLQGAAGIAVGIVSVAIIVSLVAFTQETARARMRNEWRTSSQLFRGYQWLLNLAWLSALAWAGWLWAFGIRLVWLSIWPQVVVAKPGNDPTGERP